MRKLLMILLTAGAVTLCAAPSAQAHPWHGGWHHGYYGGWGGWHHGYYGGWGGWHHGWYGGPYWHGYYRPYWGYGGYWGGYYPSYWGSYYSPYLYGYPAYSSFYYSPGFSLGAYGPYGGLWLGY